MSSHTFHRWILAGVAVLYGGRQLYRWSTGRPLLPLFSKARRDSDDWDERNDLNRWDDSSRSTDSNDATSTDAHDNDASCAADSSADSLASESVGSDSSCDSGGGSDSGGSD